MVTPGLLPEASDRRLSAWPFTIALLGIALVAGCGYLILQVVSLRAERTRLAKQVTSLTIQVAKEKASNSMWNTTAPSSPLREDASPPAAPREPEAPAEPAKAPDIRVIPPEQARERITQGLHEFRSGRYLQAELAFLRAVPEATGYLVLTCFVRGEIREASQFLGRALVLDPEWLRRVKPRDLFGAPEDYEKALRALEERVAADPLDAEAKTLLAYFRFHEKGPEYAKALLVEATNARPDLAQAKALLDSLR